MVAAPLSGGEALHLSLHISVGQIEVLGFKIMDGDIQVSPVYPALFGRPWMFEIHQSEPEIAHLHLFSVEKAPHLFLLLLFFFPGRAEEPADIGSTLF